MLLRTTVNNCKKIMNNWIKDIFKLSDPVNSGYSNTERLLKCINNNLQGKIELTLLEQSLVLWEKRSGVIPYDRFKILVQDWMTKISAKEFVLLTRLKDSEVSNSLLSDAESSTNHCDGRLERRSSVDLNIDNISTNVRPPHNSSDGVQDTMALVERLRLVINSQEQINNQLWENIQLLSAKCVAQEQAQCKPGVTSKGTQTCKENFTAKLLHASSSAQYLSQLEGSIQQLEDSIQKSNNLKADVLILCQQIAKSKLEEANASKVPFDPLLKVDKSTQASNKKKKRKSARTQHKLALANEANNRLASELDLLNQKIPDYELKINELSAELETLNKPKDVAHKSCEADAWAYGFTYYEGRAYTKLETKYEALQEKCKRIEHKFSVERKLNATSAIENKKLTEEVTGTHGRLAFYEQKYHETNNMVLMMQNDNKNLVEKNNDLQTSLNSMEMVKRYVDTVQNENWMLKMDLNKSHNRIKLLDNKISGFQQKLTEFETKCNHLCAILCEFNSAIDDFLSTVSEKMDINIALLSFPKNYNIVVDNHNFERQLKYIRTIFKEISWKISQQVLFDDLKLKNYIISEASERRFEVEHKHYQADIQKLVKDLQVFEYNNVIKNSKFLETFNQFSPEQEIKDRFFELELAIRVDSGTISDRLKSQQKKLENLLQTFYKSQHYLLYFINSLKYPDDHQFIKEVQLSVTTLYEVKDELFKETATYGVLHHQQKFLKCLLLISKFATEMQRNKEY